jgi:hypothetical protein
MTGTIAETDLGGAEALSAAERQLIRRSAVLGAIIESSEVRWQLGENVEVEQHPFAWSTIVEATLGI